MTMSYLRNTLSLLPDERQAKCDGFAPLDADEL